MMKKLQKILIVTLFFIVFQLITQPVLAEGKTIYLDYFYNKNCPSCVKPLEKDGAIWTIDQIYNDTVMIRLKQYNDPAYEKEYKKYLEEYKSIINNYPFVVINNSSDETVLPKANITVDDMRNVIDAYLAGIKPNITVDKNIETINFLFWHFRLDISGFSLPVLTIVLAGLDSFNPCAFFILIFLLNLLLYTRSRKRMVLVGGIFVFFSGLWYYAFMFVLYNTFLLTNIFIDIVTIIAGCIALTLGALSIKDFFFFKKGVSLSIPEEKRLGLFKRMRDLVKTPQIILVISGAIVLAAIVNFYELLCTLGFPLVFTRQLTAYKIPMLQSYLYIFFYNVIYVIPLIIIVLIFVFTLGRWKLSEWQGRILKLLSGIMLVSFGVLFIIDFKILQNVVTPVLLLVFSLLVTLVISFVWKKYKDKKEGV